MFIYIMLYNINNPYKSQRLLNIQSYTVPLLSGNNTVNLLIIQIILPNTEHFIY